MGPAGDNELAGLVHLVAVSWRLGRALSVETAVNLLSSGIELVWSSPLRPLVSDELLVLAMKVTFVANAPSSPITALRGTVTATETTLKWAANAADLQLIRAFLTRGEAGGFVSVDVDCNQFVSLDDRSISSSTSVLYGGPAHPLAPGGLLRLGFPIGLEGGVRDFFDDPYRGTPDVPCLVGFDLGVAFGPTRPPTRPAVVERG